MEKRRCCWDDDEDDLRFLENILFITDGYAILQKVCVGSGKIL